MLQRRSVKRRGTTLAEVLVSASFLAVVASALLTCTTQAHTRAAKAERRLAALCKAKAEIATYRSQALSGALSTGASSSGITLSAIPGPVTLIRKTTAVAGYANLFSLTITLNWLEGSQTESTSLQTYVRAPND